MTDQREQPSNEELTRFEKLARALFGVKREDVPKHSPKKRTPAPPADRPSRANSKE